MEPFSIPTLPLHDGGRIPLVGTGTLFAKGRQLADLLAQCIHDGYRMIDTAAQYANELAVGEGIRGSGVARSEIFITTKVAGGNQGKGYTRRGCEESLHKLGTDYIDLLLIHWPNPSRGLAVQTWQEMIALKEEGLVRHLGVSNFLPHQLEELHEATGIWPVLDQIQLSPALARAEVRTFLAEHEIVAEAWSPLGRSEKTMDQIIVNTLAKRHDVDPSQILLRWSVQQGIVVIPASKNSHHWHLNADLFGFELSDQEMADLATLDLGEDQAWDSRTHEEW